MYYITGTLTFSTQANRNSAKTSMDAAAAGAALFSGGRYAAGINTSGTLDITVSLSVPDQATAISLERSLFNSFASMPRNAGHLAVVKGA